jgi:two-component system, NarL family, invasion response regulator UvrY
MRILVVEDHPIVRAGVRRLLQGADGTEIFEAANAADGLRLTGELRPQVIILDLRLPDTDGLELLSPLMACDPAPKIIVFSMYEDPAFAARALEAGAKGYVTKNDDPDVLVQAVETVSNDGVFLTTSIAEKLGLLTAKIRDDLLRDLSSRERELINLIGEGKTLAEIAKQLAISYRTSASIAAQIKNKFNLNNTAALIKWAVEHQRLDPFRQRKGSVGARPRS